jgi:hypothetical protein
MRRVTMATRDELVVAVRCVSDTLAMSATIDRTLRTVPGARRWAEPVAGAPSLAVRRRVPVRTFSDWQNPPPGFASQRENAAKRARPESETSVTSQL